MSANYQPAPDEIIDLARELIDLYHEDLADARIGLLMRDKAATSNGMTVLGKAKKLSADMRAYLPYDFIIWVAKDYWRILEPMQRRALLDHELCHLIMDDDEPKIRGHDIEEFNAIIERYGYWWPGAGETVLATQRQFGFLRRVGSVTAADLAAVNGDVMDQVGDLFDRDAADGGEAV
jgi:hypothetical protein